VFTDGQVVFLFWGIMARARLPTSLFVFLFLQQMTGVSSPNSKNNDPPAQVRSELQIAKSEERDYHPDAFFSKVIHEANTIK